MKYVDGVGIKCFITVSPLILFVQNQYCFYRLIHDLVNSTSIENPVNNIMMMLNWMRQ